MRAAAAPGVRSAAARCTQTGEVGLAGGRGGSEEEESGGGGEGMAVAAAVAGGGGERTPTKAGRQ